MKNQMMTLMAAAMLAACGQNDAPTDTPKPDTKAVDSAVDHSKMDHSTMNHGSMTMAGDAGQTTGKVISISPSGSEIVIDHAEISGIGMGAMTMGFGVKSGLDISTFAPQDAVSFTVKKATEGGYTITAICNTAKDGADCLAAKMDHSGH